MRATASMSRREMIKQVALRAELVQQQAGVKVARTDEPSATVLEDALNMGVREFIRAADWTFLTGTVTLTLSPDGSSALNLNRDPRRYRMAACVESLPKERFDYMGPDDQPGGPVEIRPFEYVAGMCFRDPSCVGPPMIAGMQFNASLADGLKSAGAMELRVWPRPDQAYTVEFTAKFGAVPFVSDDQVGFWPPVHDLTVIDCAVMALFEHDKDKGDPDQARAYAAAAAKAATSIEQSRIRDNEDYRPQEMGAPNENDYPRVRMATTFDYTTNQVIVRVPVFN